MRIKEFKKNNVNHSLCECFDVTLGTLINTTKVGLLIATITFSGCSQVSDTVSVEAKKNTEIVKNVTKKRNTNEKISDTKEVVVTKEVTIREKATDKVINRVDSNKEVVEEESNIEFVPVHIINSTIDVVPH